LNNRQKEILTLITNKIEREGLRLGAHLSKNWLTNDTYIQSIFERINKVIYIQCFDTDSDIIYNYLISFNWKELIGPGSEEYYSYKIQDKKGKWHSPCDRGFYIWLWHPSRQSLHEAIITWVIRPSPYWMPEYNYEREEVIEALKIMAKTFNWEFKDIGIYKLIRRNCCRGLNV
jgi:hypothetical protein